MTAASRSRSREWTCSTPTPARFASDTADGIACWFIDTDYNEESFFVRQAYFLGANDPYKALKTTLKAEINREAWGDPSIATPPARSPSRPPAASQSRSSTTWETR